MKKFFYVFTILSLLGIIGLTLCSYLEVIELVGIFKKAQITTIVLFIAGLIAINSGNLIDDKSAIGAVGITLVLFAVVPILEIVWMDMNFSSPYGYIVIANGVFAFLVNSIIAFSGQLKKKAILLQIFSYLSVVGLCAFLVLKLYGPVKYTENKLILIGFIVCVLIFVFNIFIMQAVLKGAIGTGEKKAKEPKPKKEKKKKEKKSADAPASSDAPPEPAPADPTIGASGPPPIAF